MNIVTILEKLAHSHSQRLALIEDCPERKGLTFAQLNERVASVADRLEQSGIKSGDVILLYVPMSIKLYELLLGINRIGAVVLFIDPSYGAKELKHCINLTKPKAFVVADRLLVMARAVAPLFGITKVLPANQLTALPLAGTAAMKAQPIAAVADDAPALITFTSGSSGLPKGIVRSHGFLNAQCELLADELAIGNCQTEMTTLPIFVLANLARGVTTILPVSPKRSIFMFSQQAHSRFNRKLTSQLLEHMPERILAAPAFLMQLATALKEQNIKCHFVSEILTGGGPVFPPLIDLLREIFPQAKLTTVYGSTEAEPIAHLDVTNQNSSTLNKIAMGGGLPQGKVSPQVELAVLPGVIKSEYTDSEFDKQKGSANIIGEIVVAGDHVVKGYVAGIGDWVNKIKVDQRIFHRTGDAGYLDAEGNLFLVGRASMKVSVPNGVVYPLAVEASAMASGVIDSCAYLVVRKQRVLVVKLNKSAQKNSSEQLLASLAFANIDRLVVRANLPMDKRHSSKILYSKLKSSL